MAPNGRATCTTNGVPNRQLSPPGPARRPCSAVRTTRTPDALAVSTCRGASSRSVSARSPAVFLFDPRISTRLPSSTCRRASLVPIHRVSDSVVQLFLFSTTRPCRDRQQPADLVLGETAAAPDPDSRLLRSTTSRRRDDGDWPRISAPRFGAGPLVRCRPTASSGNIDPGSAPCRCCGSTVRVIANSFAVRSAARAVHRLRPRPLSVRCDALHARSFSGGRPRSGVAQKPGPGDQGSGRPQRGSRANTWRSPTTARSQRHVLVPPRRGRPAPGRDSAPSRCTPPARDTENLLAHTRSGRSLIVENNTATRIRHDGGRPHYDAASRGSTSTARAAAIQPGRHSSARPRASPRSRSRTVYSMPIRRPGPRTTGRLVFHGNRFSDWADGLQAARRHGTRLHNNYAPVTLTPTHRLHRHLGGLVQLRDAALTTRRSTDRSHELSWRSLMPSRPAHGVYYNNRRSLPTASRKDSHIVGATRHGATATRNITYVFHDFTAMSCAKQVQ